MEEPLGGERESREAKFCMVKGRKSLSPTSKPWGGLTDRAANMSHVQIAHTEDLSVVYFTYLF